MKKYTLYCGLNDKDTRRQEISTLEAAKMVRNACLTYADGATIFEADGIYKHDDGELVAEKTLRVELMMVEQSIVRRIVDTLKAALNQESIAVQEQEILSALWQIGRLAWMPQPAPCIAELCATSITRAKQSAPSAEACTASSTPTSAPRSPATGSSSAKSRTMRSLPTCSAICPNPQFDSQRKIRTHKHKKGDTTMAKHIFFTVRNEAIRAYLNGKSEIKLFGIVIRIQHAHSNQYQVILPDGGEIIRIVDHGNRKLAVYTV